MYVESYNSRLRWLTDSPGLLYYDYFLTFPSEVQLIWRCRWSPATGFFLAIRYGALLVITLGVAEAFYLGPSEMTARRYVGVSATHDCGREK